jgi:cytochrome P450
LPKFQKLIALFLLRIKEAIEQGRVSSPITLQEALKLPYLQAVIWEGFRMKTPVTWGHYKVVPPGGDTINGLFIPGGTAIGHNSLALARRKDIWGDDAAVFRPERWVECSADKKMEMDRAVEIVFGGGRWMCAGKSVAIMELNKVFFEVRLPNHALLPTVPLTQNFMVKLLRVFDFALVNPVIPVKEIALAGFVHTDMWMRFTEAKA